MYLGEALPASKISEQHTYNMRREANREMIPLMDSTYRQHGGDGDGGGWQQHNNIKPGVSVGVSKRPHNAALFDVGQWA